LIIVRVAGIAQAVAIFVILAGVVVEDAVIDIVFDAVFVIVSIAGIAKAVAIAVFLIIIRYERTIIGSIGVAVTIRISGSNGVLRAIVRHGNTIGSRYQ
jgi:hypothetical protein